MRAGVQGHGLGARAEHYTDLVRAHDERWPGRPEWLEAISENFMNGAPSSGARSASGEALLGGGAPLYHLDQLRQRYPLVLHGVSLNLGSSDPLNAHHLQALRALVARVEPAWVSDHLCWTGTAHGQVHDLLPLPYGEAALAHLLPRIDAVQQALGMPLVLENISSYVQFAADDMEEPQFLAELVKRSGCKLLLDVNNVYVNQRNHGLDALAFLAALPRDAVQQIHLAGHEDHGDFCIDTHDAPVRDEVWALYAEALRRFGPVPAMIERDDHIPPLPDLLAELEQARRVARAVHA